MALAALANVATSPLFMRTAAGAAAGFFAGRAGGRVLTEEDSDYRPLATISGTLLGAVAGFSFPAWRGAASAIGKGAGKRVLQHFEKMPGQYAAARAELAGSNMSAGWQMYHALTRSYMSMPLMLGGGALLGSYYADHHGMSKTQGMLLGAGLGALMKSGTALHAWWTEDMAWPGKKTVFTAGLSSAIMAHGILGRDMSTVYGASAQPLTGETIYGGPTQEYEEPATLGIKDRLANIGASGDIVLGSHYIRR